MKHLGDITRIDGSKIPLVDIVTGGSPCQDLSVAGKREGLAGERSGLFMEQIRIIKEMRNESKRTNAKTIGYVQPRYMVWENVVGAFSSGTPKGADFQAVLQEVCKVVIKAPPLCLFLQRDGTTPDALMEWVTMESPLAFAGEPMTLNSGESPNAGVESRLSQILEEQPLPKYCLSQKACLGILRRAETRGKVLPPLLKQALQRQANVEL